jgi:hypothetical protein
MTQESQEVTSGYLGIDLLKSKLLRQQQMSRGAL